MNFNTAVNHVIKADHIRPEVQIVSDYLRGKIKELCQYLKSVQVEVAVLLVSSDTWEAECLGSRTGETFLQSNPDIKNQFMNFCKVSEEDSKQVALEIDHLKDGGDSDDGDDDNDDGDDGMDSESNTDDYNGSFEADNSVMSIPFTKSMKVESAGEKHDAEFHMEHEVLKPDVAVKHDKKKRRQDLNKNNINDKKGSDRQTRRMRSNRSTATELIEVSTHVAKSHDSIPENEVEEKGNKTEPTKHWRALRVFTFIDPDGKSIKGTTSDMYETGATNEDNTTTYSCKLCPFTFNGRGTHRIAGHVKSHMSAEELSSCYICGKQYHDRDTLGTHIRRHKKLPFMCPVCKKNFPSKKAQEMHTSTHGTEFTCKYCNREFTSNKMYKRHLTVHERNKQIEESTESCYCQKCGKGFMHPLQLGKHVNTCNKGERKHACDECDGKFSTASLMRTHKRRVHEIDIQTCEICSQQLKNQLSLVRHMRLHKEAADPEKIICKVCDKVLKSKDTLRAHMAGVHGEANLQCKTCGRLYKHLGSLARHEQAHSAARPFKCQFCSKSFKIKLNLTAHENYHTKKRRYFCHICGKEYLHRATLGNHLRSHNPDRKLKKVCRYCKQIFPTFNIVIRHVRDVHEDQDLASEHPMLKKCTICGKVALTLGRLRDHMDTHNKIKRYMCSECGSVFGNKSNLSAHIKSIHKKAKFGCELCGKFYSGKLEYSKHLQTHESEMTLDTMVSTEVIDLQGREIMKEELSNPTSVPH